jgi:ATP/maltotriose-dependent transcriptional regulator MalT
MTVDMNSRRRREILTAYAGHARRFDRIAARRRRPVAPGPVLEPDAAGPTDDDCLSERQLEVLSLVAEGLSNQEICVRLDVGLETVKTHVLHILDRLSARTRAHAVGIGHKLGLLA